ncbi:UDP-glycosyltransferase 92A1 [Vitis vinifera]|uniref:Glycosyltransferase n=2 Tax=Vitis vinifera TaxID=29760 RepID=A0A438ELS9_VITVI|nr:UDP-glycosyltransferase 92A1 [Vitis vinifera]
MEKKENIVMFPYMAQGHIIPFLALALEIEKKRGCTITFVTTPLNLKKLQSSIPSNSSIVLLEIPFCSSDHGLPPNTDNTDVLPQSLMSCLDEASLSLKSPFRNLISNLVQHGPPPLCIIADIFLGWTAEIAHEFGLFHAIFCVGGGFGMACYYSLWLNVPHPKPNSNGEFSLLDFPEASTIHVTQMSENLRAADGTDPYSVFNKEALSEWMNSDGVLFNTIEELDTLGLAYFRRKIGRPVWPVGPVLLSAGGAVQEPGTMVEFYKEWLNAKPSNSVLYIAFGSQNTLSASQMMQLAMALDVSGKSFIWVIRPPLGVDVESEFKAKEWLPEGFGQRIKDQNRGLLEQKWAPQVEILSHRSISAFLSHCGWNSVFEAVSHGVPIMGWPMSAEQFYNAKFLEEEMGVCVEVARGPMCEVRHEEIVRKIELVMNATEKRKDMRKKVSEVRDMMKDAIRDEEGFRGSSVKAMDEFFNAASSTREKTKRGPNKYGQRR